MKNMGISSRPHSNAEPSNVLQLSTESCHIHHNDLNTAFLRLYNLSRSEQTKGQHKSKHRDEAREGKLQRQGPALLGRCSAIDILSIEFVELFLLVSDPCSASILSQLRNSCFIEELQGFADSTDRTPLTLKHELL